MSGSSSTIVSASPFSISVTAVSSGGTIQYQVQATGPTDAGYFSSTTGDSTTDYAQQIQLQTNSEIAKTQSLIPFIQSTIAYEQNQLATDPSLQPGSPTFNQDNYDRVTKDLASNQSALTRNQTYLSQLQSFTVPDLSAAISSTGSGAQANEPAQNAAQSAAAQQIVNGIYNSGPANDDSGGPSNNPVDCRTQPKGTAASAGTVTTPNTNAKSPAPVTNQPDVLTTKPSSPGRRLKNPLAYLSSYTYQITLYMVSPDAYDAFVASGRRSLSIINNAGSAGSTSTQGGAWIIAQSGGINNSATGSTRATGFNYDYYIDNLVMKQTTNMAVSATNTNFTTVTFNITEPYGFSFVTNLKKASDAISSYVKTLGKNSPYDATKHIFVLGIKFNGWNPDGSIAKPTDVYDGNALDPASTDGTLFEHYHDIAINNIKTKIDGRTVVYNVEASSMSQIASCSKKRGVTSNDITITGPTVQDAIQQLMDALNKIQTDRTKTNPPVQKNATTYKVQYTDAASVSIARARIVTPANTDKTQQPNTSAPKTSQQSNPATEQKAKTDVNSRNFNITSGRVVLDAINDIIKQSTYLTDALKSFNTNDIESDTKKEGFTTINSPGKDIISWFTCNPSVSKPIWDDSINDWSYTITYIIDTYLTPVVNSPYAKAGAKYYGPSKHYDYWYTGKNSEIISYEQTLNNLYFTVALAGGQESADSGTGGSNSSNAHPGSTTTTSGTAPSTAAKGTLTPAVTPDLNTDQSRLGSTGYGMAAQNSYITSLFDPDGQATFNVTIFGDPDYMMEPTTSITQVYDKFYGTNGFTINPNGGQVFIEIDFKEAVDYTSGGGGTVAAADPTTGGITSSPGTLSINSSIAFFATDPTIKTNGIPYQINEVEHSFSQGSFKQKLTGFIANLPGAQPDTSGNARPATTSSSASGPSTPASNSSSNSGTKTDTPINTAQPQQTPANKSNNTQSQQTTSGGVANDDAAIPPSNNPVGPSPGPNYTWNSTTGAWVGR